MAHLTPSGHWRKSHLIGSFIIRRFQNILELFQNLGRSKFVSFSDSGTPQILGPFRRRMNRWQDNFPRTNAFQGQPVFQNAVAASAPVKVSLKANAEFKSVPH